MEQREQILSRFDITIDILLEYYTSRLRKSIYKSLMRKCLKDLGFDDSLISSIIIDEKTTRKDLSLYGTGYIEQTKNFKDYKNKDRHVRRTLVSFQNNMFPGVRIDPRGGSAKIMKTKMITIMATKMMKTKMKMFKKMTSTQIFI